MKWVLLAAATLAAATLAAACGASHGHAESDQATFDCRDRSASYLATHTMGGDVGIQMDCKEQGPRLLQWRTGSDGKRIEKSRVMTPAEFDKIWNQIDATGWPNMQDCTGSGKADDPVYQFMVSDDQNHASFSCQAREMPYPYNDISDPLLMAASRSGQQ